MQMRSWKNLESQVLCILSIRQMQMETRILQQETVRVDMFLQEVLRISRKPDLLYWKVNKDNIEDLQLYAVTMQSMVALSHWLEFGDPIKETLEKINISRKKGDFGKEDIAKINKEVYVISEFGNSFGLEDPGLKAIKDEGYGSHLEETFKTGEKALEKLGGRKTVIFEFLGTGMISVMPVPLLSVHPRGCSQRGHIRYVPSVCACCRTCPVPLHKPLLQAL